MADHTPHDPGHPGDRVPDGAADENPHMAPDEAKIAARMAREDTNIFSRLPAVYAASRAQGQRLLKIGGGLSIVEWRVLWDLSDAGPMTIRDLARIQRADHSLLSRALPQMQDKGLVRMRKDVRDGRQMVVSLTAAGRAAHARAAPVMAARRAALATAFTPDEIHAAIGFLERLEAFLDLPVDTWLPAQTETPA